MTYIYKSIVLTSIDVIESPTSDRPNRVIFPASRTKGARDDKDATFIHKVKDVITKDGQDSDFLEAERLLPGQVQEIINEQSSDEKERSSLDSKGHANRKILFSVHGFNLDPREYLLKVKSVEERFKKFKLIPVLWPSAGSLTRYFGDRMISKGAGRAFQSIVEPIESFDKSLLCHSMGNYVLRNFASASYNFDNIFMVASDVESKIFHEHYIEGGRQEWHKDGLRITQMLNDKKEGSKVHIVFNKNDAPLLLSAICNRKSRLGRDGIPPGTKLHDQVKEKIVPVDWTNNSPSSTHNYQFDRNLVAYYESQYIS